VTATIGIDRSQPALRQVSWAAAREPKIKCAVAGTGTRQLRAESRPYQGTRKPNNEFGGYMAWWQTAVIYQIYPRSFQDTNGDGIGDLAGIQQRLPYLAVLGVDAIWLSPIYPSPMADFGYDISDYTNIDPIFGSLPEFDSLLAEAHQRGIRLILDLVPNHTSDQHPWFIESRASRDSSKRNWYIWRDPARDGGPPNNWLSEFGGSAWEFDPHTAQYYCHTFLSAQPDLNWWNPDLRAAMYDVMRFWLARGVDGFRVDVIWHLIKDKEYRDNPLNPAFRPGQPPHQSLVPLYTTDRPEVHDVIRQMRLIVDEFSDRVLIGEIYLPIERLVAYYGRDLQGLHMPFNFALLSTSWQARLIALLIEEYEFALPPGGWPNWVLGNHDWPRIASRIGAKRARCAAILLHTLRGTPTIYYGDEIGMQQVMLRGNEIQDPFEKRVPGLGLGRDGCRTPMQWNGEQFAGFSISKSWLPVELNYRNRNVAGQKDEPASMLQLYRRLIELRRSHGALQIGSYRPIKAADELLLFVREHGGEKLLIALNMAQESMSVGFANGLLRGEILLSSFCDRDTESIDGNVNLRSDEGAIIKLAADAIVPG
jgi:alpha-glucosidase